tara:strand:- start:20259 stop:21671 length:1413 start_codon:yes stop_codon:yes gene_type:complete
MSNRKQLAIETATYRSTLSALKATKQFRHVQELKTIFWVSVLGLILYALFSMVKSVKRKYGFIMRRIELVQQGRGLTNQDLTASGVGPDHTKTTLRSSPLFIAMCFDWPILSLAFENRNLPEAIRYAYSNANALKRMLPMFPHVQGEGGPTDSTIWPINCQRYPPYYAASASGCPDVVQGPLFHFSEERYFEALVQKSKRCSGFDPNESQGNKNCSAQYMVCEVLFSYCDTTIDMSTLLDDSANVVGNLYWSRMIPGCGYPFPQTMSEAQVPIPKDLNLSKPADCQKLYAQMTQGDASLGNPNANTLLNVPEQRSPRNLGLVNQNDMCFADVSLCHPTCGATAYDDASHGDQIFVRQEMMQQAASGAMTGGAIAGAISPLLGAGVLGTLVGVGMAAVGMGAGASYGRKLGLEKIQSKQRLAKCQHARANCRMGCISGFCPQCSDWYPENYAAEQPSEGTTLIDALAFIPI